MDKGWQELLKIDQEGMLWAIQDFPRQAEAGLALVARIPASLESPKLACLGMGGSAIPGDILARFAKVPVFVVRGYQLPPWLPRDTLVVGLSYSGETEETLSAFSAAVDQGFPCLAITTGGKLAELCEERGIPWIPVPKGLQPRAALGFLLFPLLGLLHQNGLLLGNPYSAIPILQRLSQAFSPKAEGNPAERLAQELRGKVPLVYGAGPTAPVALRWKTQMNENAKQPGFWAELPELCHNEIVGYELAGGIFPQGTIVFLRTPFDHPRVGRRVEILKEVLSARALPFHEVWGEGEDELSQALALLYLGDWVSFYLALLNEVDPTPVKPIQELKERLRD